MQKLKSKRGVFIVIDGTDGSGKATQTELLVKKLKEQNHQVKMFDFPQYGKKSAALVEEYLNGKYGTAEEVGPYKASLFYACDRFAATKEINSYLEKGYIVISNRYTSSNMGHQAGKIPDKKERDKFLSWLEDLEFNLLEIPRPDLVMLLYLDPKTSQERVDMKDQREYLGDKKRDIHENDLQHLEDARKAYKDVAENYNWPIIDASESIETVHNNIWSIVSEKISQRVLS